MSTIAFEKVGQAINDWYKVIKQHNKSRAAEMREEIEIALPNMKENQNVLIYFSLIDSRYKLMTEDYNESGELLNNIKAKALESNTDDMIQYYFYFFQDCISFIKRTLLTLLIFIRLLKTGYIKYRMKLKKLNFTINLQLHIMRLGRISFL
ncbi:hypothetical protein QKW52_25795 [Bacillus sonorensis]|nr:hypothetical protein [Bacillus sonorensis]